jgi:alpha-galactosidase
MLEDSLGIKGVKKEEIKVNVIGVNHFTWITSAHYKNIDLFPLYREFADKYAKTGFLKGKDDNWMNNYFDSCQKVKLDLFRRYGYIAAAGDRHLAEFCEGKWYLASPETAKSWGFSLTPVSWRKEDLRRRLEASRRKRSGEEKIKLGVTGEDGVNQIRALLGLHTMVTNVNLPNMGQIPNLPLGAVVETNAVFDADGIKPVMAGPIPNEIYGLISRIVSSQEVVVEAALKRDVELAFTAFINDPLVTVGFEDARKLYFEMLENTKEYLKEYNF